MREWQLTADDPLAMRFAADVRLSRTDYNDDQSWEVVFGGPQEPALSIQTRYGGRTGLARIVPMWILGGQAVYEGQAFAERPILRAFAPNYARITAKPATSLGVTFELWVMDSHAVGGRFTLHNQSNAPLSLSLELFPQIVREGKSITMKVMRLSDGTEALALGAVGGLNPVLLLEGSSGSREAQLANPKLTAPLTIPANGSVAQRWVHAGLHSLDESIQAAHQWLYETDWDGAFSLIEKMNARTLTIETGDADLDAALAWAGQVTLRSYIGPSGKLPYPSFVNTRIPARGFSSQPNGSDHPSDWAGQTGPIVYLTAPTTAILAPDLARGAIRDELAARQSDGWIDWKVGLGGQRSPLLVAPMLASAAWAVYEITEDKHFLAEVFKGLLACFMRWFSPDQDRDGDGVPEWTNALHSGHEESSTFNRWRRWSVNADISKAETPDLIAMLIREAHSLLRIDEALGSKSTAAPAIQTRLDTLQTALKTMWDGGAFQNRDRDTHRTLHGTSLFRGKGDESYSGKATLDPANRLILRTLGGKEHAPHVTAVIEGVNQAGAAVSETLPASAFVWYYGLGTAVSEQVYSRVNYVRLEGLSRVYSVEIDTLDLSRQSITELLPLWAGAESDQLAALVRSVTDEARYWLPAGLPTEPANQPTESENPNHTVSALWNTLVAEGLIERGYPHEAATLIGRLLTTQVAALKHDHAFRNAYDARTGNGSGDPDDLSGVFPISLFLKLAGVRIVSERRVWAGGEYALGQPMSVMQFGVRVERSAQGTRIRFPSGYETQVDSNWQLIEDPTAVPEPEPVAAPAQPAPPTPNDAQTVIPVEAKRDATVEIPITGLDFTSKPDEPAPSEPPVTYKIPVRGPRKDKPDE